MLCLLIINILSISMWLIRSCGWLSFHISIYRLICLLFWERLLDLDLRLLLFRWLLLCLFLLALFLCFDSFLLLALYLDCRALSLHLHFSIVHLLIQRLTVALEGSLGHLSTLVTFLWWRMCWGTVGLFTFTCSLLSWRYFFRILFDNLLLDFIHGFADSALLFFLSLRKSLGRFMGRNRNSLRLICRLFGAYCWWLFIALLCAFLHDLVDLDKPLFQFGE